MNKRFSIITILTVILIGLGCSGCTDDQELSQQILPEEDHVYDVTFDISGSVALRSLQTTTLRSDSNAITTTKDSTLHPHPYDPDFEKRVSHLYAIIFDSADAYQGLYEVEITQQNETLKGQFQLSNSGSYQLFLLANPDSALLKSVRAMSNVADLNDLVTVSDPLVDQDFVMTSTALKAFAIAPNGSTNIGTINIQRLAARFDIYSFSNKFRVSSVVMRNRYKSAYIHLGQHNSNMNGLSKELEKTYEIPLDTIMSRQIYSYSNFIMGDEDSATMLIINGEYNGVEAKGITVKINKPIKRNTIYNIIITPKNATIDGATVGGEYKGVTFNTTVNDWGEPIDFTLSDNVLYDTSAPSYTITGMDVTQTGDSIKIGSEGGSLSITTMSPSTKAELSAPSLPTGWELSPQGTSTIDDETGLLKRVYLLTVPTAEQRTSFNLVLRNTLSGGETRTIAVTQDAPKVEEPGADETDFAGKSVWVYGTNGIPFDKNNLKKSSDPNGKFSPGSPEKFPKGGWFGIDDKFFEGKYYLMWDESYNWYDCNKINPKGDKDINVSDSRLCWACTASGILHWWMYHNRDYIKKYTDEYGDTDELFGKRPSMKMNPDGSSPIMDFFTKHSENIGSYPPFGVNWFVQGISTGMYLKTKQKYQFKGFFHHVFTEKSDAAAPVIIKSIKKEKFNNFIKQALMNKEAIAIDIAHPQLGGHAMNIWGAEFDEEGIIRYLYYSDNNDGLNFDDSGTFERRRLRRDAVTYNKNNDVFLFRAQVMGLQSVNLKRDVWAKKYGELPLE